MADKKIVFDTSVIKHIHDSPIISSKKVASEVRKHGLNDCYVKGYESSEPTKACVNSVIMNDIANINMELRSSEVNRLLKDARDLPESMQRTYLERAWEQIPRNFKRKKWVDQVTGAEADCSQITLAKKHNATLYTRDRVLLEQCKEEHNDCKSLSL